MAGLWTWFGYLGASPAYLKAPRAKFGTGMAGLKASSACLKGWRVRLGERWAGLGG